MWQLLKQDAFVILWFRGFFEPQILPDKDSLLWVRTVSL